MVLFVSYSGALGGAERLLLDFAPGVAAECVIACPPGALAAEARRRGVRTFALQARTLRLRGDVRMRAGAARDLFGHASELRRLVQASEPELTVLWGMRSALAAPVLGDRRLAFQHNDFLPGRAIALAVRRAARRMALVTAPSQAVARELGVRARVISPGVDVERFPAAPPPAGPPEILVLGAITAWKRPDLALEAFARVRSEVPDARLRLAGTPLPGDGPALVEALRAQARRLGIAEAVEFAGAVADPAVTLARASCLLHCAEREPFGIAVLEALAAARPAVVPDSAGPAEIVGSDCGRRYRPGDADAAAAALVETLGDPASAARMGAAGRARAAARFSLEGQRGRYRAAIAPLLGAGQRPLRAAGRRPRPAADFVVVTVTHNSETDVAALLESLRRHLPEPRVVVADCASRDRSVAVARERGAAMVLELPNVGFGRACNHALAGVCERIAVLLNPDVELIDDSLLELVAEVRERDLLLAPRVLNGDGSLQDTVHPAPLSAPALAHAVVPPAALPRRLGYPLAPWRAEHPRRVGWAVGCALVARTQTLRGLGPFDERIFLYGEDMELGLRAARGGVETWFWPAGRVIHHGGHSIEAAHGGEAFELRARARHDSLAIALGKGHARLDDAAQALTFASRLALKRALGRPAARERAQLRALRSR